MSNNEKHIDFSQKPRNHPLPPIELYQQVFCKHCQNPCDIDSPKRQHCTLASIANEIALLRQTIQQRTQHLSW